MLSKSTSKVAKLYDFMKFLQTIGLQSPSEKTFQVMTAIYLCCSSDEAVVDAMDHTSKKIELQYMKDLWKQRAPTKESEDEQPPVFVATLPPDPTAFPK